MTLLQIMLPELILVAAACALFLIGFSSKTAARRAAAPIALIALIGSFAWQIVQPGTEMTGLAAADEFGTFRVFSFAQYIKLLTTGIAVLFVLLSWPDRADGRGNRSLDYGNEAGEFFALMLLSIAGVMIVAAANDIVLLFLGLELASIPTYIMVSMSRPLPVAQEAGVKYFFLGAMSAAVMLFGFSYLYGVTGTTNLYEISLLTLDQIRAAGEGVNHLSPWMMLALVMLIAGFAFKMAVVPLHFYAGDVYQGAATPVTALLSYVPKASGLVALLKVLFAVGGAMQWQLPPQIVQLIWVLAVLTMTVGNTLALLQTNVKRVLAYSSIAHSGYLLVGVTALLMGQGLTREHAMIGILFYLTAYGIMNAGAFGVLMLLPSRQGGPATTAETYEDLAGQGRRYTALGLAMAVCCFSLTGIPLTIGFFGKILLIWPAFEAGALWLVIITMINAAISAAYYLRIVGTMFLRPEPGAEEHPASPRIEDPRFGAPAAALEPPPRNLAVNIAIALSVAGTLLFGSVWPATQMLHTQTMSATRLEPTMPMRFIDDENEEQEEEEEAVTTRVDVSE